MQDFPLKDVKEVSGWLTAASIAIVWFFKMLISRRTTDVDLYKTIHGQIGEVYKTVNEKEVYWQKRCELLQREILDLMKQHEEIVATYRIQIKELEARIKELETLN